VQRVAGLIGRDAVALGSDMDGGFGPNELPIGLDHPTKLGALADALRQQGWSEAAVNGFAYNNWRQFLERALPG
jgi:membrane dipeptidase